MIALLWVCFREALNKSTFHGEPAQLCDAGISKTKGLVPLTLPQKFLGLFNQRFLNRRIRLHFE
jgi:hypothetical protein